MWLKLPSRRLWQPWSTSRWSPSPPVAFTHSAWRRTATSSHSAATTKELSGDWPKTMTNVSRQVFLNYVKFLQSHFYILLKICFFLLLDKKTFFCLRQSRIGGHDCADKCRRLSQRCPDKRRTSLHLGKLQGIRGQDRSHAGRKGSTVSHSSCSPSQSHQDCFRFSYFGFLGKLIYCSSSVVALFFIS